MTKPSTPGGTGSSSKDKDISQETKEGGMGANYSAPSGDIESSTEEDEGEESTQSEDILQDTSRTTPTSAEEVERLRDAMNAKLSLSQQRERLARHLSERDRQGSASGQGGQANPTGKSRVSPIHEETTHSPSIDAAFSSPNPEVETTSTESAKTIRGGLTPAAFAVRTPSYPFPSMKTPRQLSYSGHRPFTALSPTVTPSNFYGDSFQTPRDRWNTSGSATPASAATFQPSGTYQSEDPKYPSPNLYEWSLRLSAEPGLDAWWTTVVAMMRDEYKADRVSLAIPADATDVENVPWGQKASYSAVVEDELSITYLPRGSSFIASSGGDTNEMNSSEGVGFMNEDPTFVSGFQQQVRPGLQSRHSFTAYEDSKKSPASRPEASRAPGTRPSLASRSKSYFPGGSGIGDAPRAETLRNAELNLQHLEEHLAFEDAQESRRWNTGDTTDAGVHGRVFPVLQALDYEADPLIDSSGVTKVLERGRLIALTRDYPYLNEPQTEAGGDPNQKSSPRTTRKSKEPSSDKSKSKPGLASRLSSFMGGSSKSSQKSSRTSRSQAGDKAKGAATSAIVQVDDEAPPESPRYEEYEQAPPSPWSQSPAPSPAVRANANENPFFANTEIVEESFNPQTQQAYSGIEHVETIGVDRSYTVLHIPLDHILLSKPVQAFRLNTAALESKSSLRSKSYSQQKLSSTEPSGNEPLKEKRTPVAILSILSSVIPYPSNLRHSLEHLAPHLATSFQLCRHYSDLENQIAGLSRKRPQVTGFGAVARPQDEHNFAANAGSFAPEGDTRQHSAGSMTSPSEYSGMSRSNAGSPAHTPGWDPSIIGLNVDRRSTGGSPGSANVTTDGYFGTRVRQIPARADAVLPTSATGGRRSSASKDASPPEGRHTSHAQSEKPYAQENTRHSRERRDATGSPETGDSTQVADDNSQTTPKPRRMETKSRNTPSDGSSDPRDASPSRHSNDGPLSPRRIAIRGAAQGPPKSERPHTKLHSGGVDLGTTYPSLPRSAPIPGVMEMLPPTDRLKTLMLDTLPAHVFVALPITGEMVWVNNPFLTYRGQTVSQLYADPWGCIHPDEREAYLTSWKESVRTGQPFSTQVRIRRFDGRYRWFFARAVAGKDTKNVIQHWYGSYMDIHDQHLAEVTAARQEEKLNSEANYRLLANLIPQIIFAASEDKGVIFSNEQWLAYTGQSYDDAMETGFMDFVHPEDLARCRIPIVPPSPSEATPKQKERARLNSQVSSGGNSSSTSGTTSQVSDTPTDITVKIDRLLSRTSSSSSGSKYELSGVDLAELARSGVIKVSTDSDGKQSYTTEIRLRSKTGEYRWHLVRCVAVDQVKFGNGEGSWFGACTDINDHKVLEAKLKEAMESKGKFLSNMSHEIRTPLIGISGMVSFLQDTTLDEEQLDYTNTIATSATNLLAIINDILDLSKVDAGMMKLSYEWFYPRSLIEDVNELVSTMAISKRLELNYVVEEDVPSVVKGDKIRIRQVLLNVIGNAIKFTPIGEVFSRCRVWHDKSEDLAENQIMLEFSIIDTGNGFTKEEAELIFKPFSQIDGSSTRQHGGSGLGLVISRQLVELHGGKMTGSAIPGEGSTFRFTAKFGVPTETDRPPPIRANTQSTASSSISGDASARAMKSAGGNAILATKFLSSPTPVSPVTDPSVYSPAIASSGSSAPSVRSIRTHLTDKSSASSINVGLTHFSEAARASGLDPLSMKLAIPSEKSPGATPTADSVKASHEGSGTFSDYKHFQPPMYSILIICPQVHSREATTKHIEQTLPKDIPHQITPLASVEESQSLLTGDNPIRFTHIVLNLGTADEIISLLDQIFTSTSLPHTSVIILSDPQQRQTVMRFAPKYDYEQLAKDNRLNFIFKPVKPSRFAFIFDPDKERDLSTDRNRSTAQQAVADQKQNYLEAEKRLGKKGYKVLLVEDNLVNQKVLLKFLNKVGLDVEIALDGLECTEKVFSLPHGYYSLILVSLVLLLCG